MPMEKSANPSSPRPNLFFFVFIGNASFFVFYKNVPATHVFTLRFFFWCVERTSRFFRAIPLPPSPCTHAYFPRPWAILRPPPPPPMLASGQTYAKHATRKGNHYLHQRLNRDPVHTPPFSSFFTPLLSGTCRRRIHVSYEEEDTCYSRYHSSSVRYWQVHLHDDALESAHAVYRELLQQLHEHQTQLLASSTPDRHLGAPSLPVSLSLPLPVPFLFSAPFPLLSLSLSPPPPLPSPPSLSPPPMPGFCVICY